jgi:hypothetical protein
MDQAQVVEWHSERKKDELSRTKKKKMETYSRNVHNQFPGASQIHICIHNHGRQSHIHDAQ